MTAVHEPLDNRIFHKECRALAEAGYDVTLIVPHPHDEEIRGVRLRAISPPRNRLDRFTRTHLRIYREARRQDAAIFHFHDPELIPLGLLLRAQGKQVIYDSHEDLKKHIMAKYWISPRIQRIVGWCARLVERLGVLSFAAIVAATPSIERNFPPRKTIKVQNFPRLDEIKAGTKRHRDRDPSIVYIGGLRAVRGIREMLLAMELLPPDYEARLELGGTFMPPELEAEARAMPGWKHVRFHGWVDRDQVTEILREARVGLAVLHPIPNLVEAQPTKIYEYMAAAIPVVASDFPLYREIVEGAGCGILVDPLDPHAIVKATTWLFDHPEEAEEMGLSGQKAAHEKYNWKVESDRLIDLYGKLLGRRAG